MFIDKVEILIKAGNGGNGAVSFHREKYIAKGGPDGGDGGKGGDVIFEIAEGENTLVAFKHRRHFSAQNGEDGKQKKFHGKKGQDLVLRVPPGTIIRDKESGSVIVDMSTGEPFVAAKGGKGGWGNTHFATPTRQIPRFAKSGKKGEERTVILELKVLADVGLAGFPNVGKSTFLSVVSSATPKIANYHFTTLAPNLGVVNVYDKSFVVADIPGLIEGASEGLGLGHSFLRHIDRCRLVLHMFDISCSERDDALEDIIKINAELEKYSLELSSRPQILVGNKIDNGYDQMQLERVEAYAAEKGYDVFLISGATGKGIEELLRAVAERLASLPPVKVYESDFFEETESEDRGFDITVEDGVYYVTGAWIERVSEDINFDDYESLNYFQKILKNAGLFEALEKMGINEGDTVDVCGLEFDFMY